MCIVKIAVSCRRSRIAMLRSLRHSWIVKRVLDTDDDGDIDIDERLIHAVISKVSLLHPSNAA